MSAKNSPITPEKRLARFRSNPSTDVLQRIERALSQRMYLIDQSTCNTLEESGLNKKFAVLGSTGNVYNVIISRLPSCTCPDFIRGHLCKHLLFVILRVLGVNKDSYVVYQKALLQTELAEMFSSANIIEDKVKTNEQVVAAFKKETSNAATPSNSQESKADDEVIELVDVECPICFEGVSKAAGAEALKQCEECRKYMHADCINKWLARSRTCVLCRSVWKVPSSGMKRKKGSIDNEEDEGYVNFASLQGMHGLRDTSTYYQRPFRSYARRGGGRGRCGG